MFRCVSPPFSPIFRPPVQSSLVSPAIPIGRRLSLSCFHPSPTSVRCSAFKPRPPTQSRTHFHETVLHSIAWSSVPPTACECSPLIFPPPPSDLSQYVAYAHGTLPTIRCVFISAFIDVPMGLRYRGHVPELASNYRSSASPIFPM